MSWDTSFTTNLEGTKIFVPEAVGSLRFRFPPQFQLIQVFGSDLSFAKPLEQVIPQTLRQVRPLDFGQLFPEGQLGQFLFNALAFDVVLG